MVDLSRNLKEETLVRKRLGDFLKARSVQQTLFSEALARIKANKWNAVIFGGVLRDLTILGPTEQPRDIDVVADVPQSQMEKALGDLTSSRNRFGGLRVNATGIQIDIWALESTWALRDEPRTDLSFDRLVSTTFLNAEAIAVDVLPKKGQKREIYSAGFFEAIRKRTLDISFEPNPPECGNR